MTYSVVMWDRATGALGVAGHSHWFNLGRIVPWVRAGVGAVATQSIADPMYGPRALDLLGAGESAPQTLVTLLDADDQRDYRQVAIVDSAGRVAAHTGSLCIRHAGHEIGDGWSVQANIMRDDSIVPAMATAAHSATGPLAERLMSVLEAAERAGGDLRGSQSAALVVAGDGPVLDVDLRVDDHTAPIAEMRRLLDLHAVYEHMSAGDDAHAAGDHEAAARHYAVAGEASPNPEVDFWRGLGLATMGDTEGAVAVLSDVAARNPDLIDLLRRLPECGLADPDVTQVLLQNIETQ